MPETTPPLRRLLNRLFGSPSSEVDQRLEQVDAVVDGATAVALTEACMTEVASLARGELRASSRALERELDSRASNLLGRALQGLDAEDPRAALATALGSSMAGLRSTVFLSGHELLGALDQLVLAASRHLPLVVHLECRATGAPGQALGSGHGAYHAVADAGALMLMAGTVQEAIDLTLVARALSEQALVPSIIAMDAEQTAASVQAVQLPSAELVQAYLGDSSDPIMTPTPAQSILFGETRRRVPRWYDLERPVMYGATLGREVYGLGAAAQRPFFYDHVPALLDAALSTLAKYTGRECGALVEHGLSKAKTVIVAQGSAIGTAQAVAEHLNESSRARVGVLGIRHLRPLDDARIAERLAAAEQVLVLERADALLGALPPLLRELRHTISPRARLRSVLYGLGGLPLRAADLAAACRDPGGPSPVYLGVDFTPSGGDYPRREAAIDGLRRAYPELARLGLRSQATIDVRPPGALSVALHRVEGRGLEHGVHVVAELLRETLGGGVQTRSVASADGWDAATIERIDHGPAQMHDPGDDAPVEILLAAAPLRRSLEAGFGPLSAGGVVVVDSDGELELPPEAARQVSERSLVVYRSAAIAGEDATQHDERLLGALFGALVDADRLELELRKLVGARRDMLAALDNLDEEAATRPVEAFAAGFEGVARVARVESSSDGPCPEREVPHLVEQLRPRRPDAESAIDSLPRFWGEIGALYRDGNQDALSPDPYLATGAIPPLSSAFRQRSAASEVLPVFDLTRCNGCSRCWSACPEGAIGALVIDSAGLIDAGMAKTKSAGALRPMLSKLGPRLNKFLGSQTEIAASAGALIQEACAAMLAKAPLPDERKQPMLEAFDALVDGLRPVPVARTEPFFTAAEQHEKSSGGLLSLAIDPGACKGCGACVQACHEQALVSLVPTAERVADANHTWSAWRELPDTSGSAIHRATKHPEVGELPALLLSRHCAQAVARGDGVEPGSGAKLALRLVLASAEKTLQKRLQGQVQQVEELRKKLADKLRDTLAEALPTGDLEALAERLDGAERGAISLGELTAKQGADQSGGVDVVHARGLVSAAKQLEQLQQRLTEGPHGLGRARLGMVLVRDDLLRGLGTFPHNPFQIPTIIDDHGEAAALARGAMEGQLRAVTRDLARLRRARLELKNPTEAALASDALARLTFGELTDEERRLCPPLLLVGGAGAFGDRSLSRLLESGLPIKVLLLSEERSGLSGGREAHDRGALAALALGLPHRHAFVLQSSIAFPAHLAAGLGRALDHDGPALIHIHAPSPGRHGFAGDRALDHALLAVKTRAFPLFVLNPEGEGVFGSRLDLRGNPDLNLRWSPSDEGSELTPADWAITEGRFRAHFTLAEGEPGKPMAEHLELDRATNTGARKGAAIVDNDGVRYRASDELVSLCERRLGDWRTLQELAGVSTPFTERVWNEARQSVAAEHQAELAGLRREREDLGEQIRAEYGVEMAQQIKQRLLTLAGYSHDETTEPS